MERICVVTPNLNQAPFLEQTMKSVLDTCPAEQLDYVVMDGGSTDGSIDIIKKYESRLHYWQSSEDDGQYAAIAEGFHKSDATIMAWLNSDDLYLPYTLKAVLKIFRDVPEIDWITTQCALSVNMDGLPIAGDFHLGADREGFYLGDCFPWGAAPSGPFIQQESTFWRRGLWEAAGSRFDAGLRIAADFELWHRFLGISEPAMVEFPLGIFRLQKENRSRAMADLYRQEASSILMRTRQRKPDIPDYEMKRHLNKRMRAAGAPIDIYPEAPAPPRKLIKWLGAQDRYFLILS